MPEQLDTLDSDYKLVIKAIEDSRLVLFLMRVSIWNRLNPMRNSQIIAEEQQIDDDASPCALCATGVGPWTS